MTLLFQTDQKNQSFVDCAKHYSNKKRLNTGEMNTCAVKIWFFCAFAATVPSEISSSILIPTRSSNFSESSRPVCGANDVDGECVIASDKEQEGSRERIIAKETSSMSFKRPAVKVEGDKERMSECQKLDENAFWSPKELGENSISPWTYCVNYDSMRIPDFIYEARCKTAKCLYPSGEEDVNLVSIPIAHEITVIRKLNPLASCDSCGGECSCERMNITVGCTCVHRI